MKFLVRSLFVLVLAGVSGTNLAAWHKSHVPLLSQADALELVVELQEDSPEESGGSGDGFNSGDDGKTVQFPIAFKAFFYPEQVRISTTGRTASIRQFKVNLLNSFRAPAFFILFNTYQGYLS